MVSSVLNNIYQNYVPTQNTVKVFLWDKKEWIAAGVVIGLVIWKIVHYIRNRPQIPLAKINCSTTHAVLEIKFSEENYTPPKVNLAIGIDTSGSMNSPERIGEVRKALNTLLDNADQAVKRKPPAEMTLAITGFTHISRVITFSTALTEGKSAEIKRQLEKLIFDGGTNMLVGYEGMAHELNKMAANNPKASNYGIFLTDGEFGKDGDRLDNQKLSRIQKSLSSAKVFVVGIGEKHPATKKESEDTLSQLATGEGFNGTYIDTKKQQNSIQTAIASVYNQAIPSFDKLEVSCSLPPNTWSIDGALSVADKTGSKCPLGSLAKGQTMTVHLVIHGERLPGKLDLSKLFFKLIFKDPKGKEGDFNLYWNNASIVDPAIEKACLRYR